MVRPLRIEYPNACYHITCRGNQRVNIFKDDKDRKRFLNILAESLKVFRVEVHCYILMSNHFHFLLKTLEANLGRFMQRFNTAYITYYNLRHQRSGHLYQGRYKALLVEICYRLNYRKKSLREIGRELGGIRGEQITQVHNLIKARLKRSRKLETRLEGIISGLST